MRKGKSIKYVDTLLEELSSDINAIDAQGVVTELEHNLDDVLQQLERDVEWVITDLPEPDEYKIRIQKIIYDLSELKNDILEKYSKLDEMMATSASAGGMDYSTPMAFSKSGETSKKIKQISTMFGMKPVEKTNKWFKKTDNNGHIINEHTDNKLKLNTSLYTRMMKTINGDI